MMRLRTLALLVACTWTASAADFDYGLRPRRVADDTYVLVGTRDDFAPANGGNAVNAAFIVSADGVVVIDTGPSRRYGEQLRAAIARVTARPVVRVFNTHHHPDHMLGNQAFSDVGVHALPAARSGESMQGPAFLDNMYRLVLDWMAGTELAPATRDATPGTLPLSDRTLDVMALSGHSAADLVILDRRTGVLFAGDLVFLDRAPSTPHADLPAWRTALRRLDGVPHRLLVPGHGEPHAGRAGIAQTLAWLEFLDSTFQRAADSGAGMVDVLATPLPTQFRDVDLASREFERSVAHLYPRYEEAALAGR